MTTKHTKGSWHKRNGDTDNYFEIIGDFETNKTIASLPSHAFVSYDEADANAKLIASAPELLESLEELAGILKWMTGHLTKAGKSELTKALGVIEKATF